MKHSLRKEGYGYPVPRKKFDPRIEGRERPGRDSREGVTGRTSERESQSERDSRGRSP